MPTAEPKLTVSTKLLQLALTLPPSRVRWNVICAAAALEFTSRMSGAIEIAPIRFIYDEVVTRFIRGEDIPATVISGLREAMDWAERGQFESAT